MPATMFTYLCVFSRLILTTTLWVGVHAKSLQSCLTLCNLVSCQASLSVGFSRQEYWSVFPCPPPGDLSNPEIKPRCPALQVDSLPSEPPGKSKNTGVGRLPLLQGIFLTQESNQGLLHYRQILYKLSYQGTPKSNQIRKPIQETPEPIQFIILFL